MSRSPFDLKVVMRAMPGIPRPPNSSCYIDMLPTEILCMIFDYFSHLTSSGRGSVPPPILLSHISHHWRRVTLTSPVLWEKLQIYHVRRPEVLRDFLTRSQQRSLYITIHLPQTIFWSGDDVPDFDETFAAIAEQLPRLRYLSITARNLTTRRLTDKYLVNVPLPHLQHFELVACNDSSLAVYGPFSFDPRVFTSMRLEHTMIQVKDGVCLSGLRSVVLSECPLTYLDERKIPSVSYPAAPMNWYTDLPNPSFSRLAKLYIHAPMLHPVPGHPAPPLMNAEGQPVASLPFAPSFRIDVLRSVTLSSLSLSKMPYNAEPNADVLARLFRIVCLAELVELHILDLTDQAIDGFLQALQVYHCRFGTLRVLRLTRVQVEQIIQFSDAIGVENFRILFSNAFPILWEVHLSDLDPEPLVSFLEKVDFWPMLHQVFHDGKPLRIRLAMHRMLDEGNDDNDA
ncbi:hypothetical protein AX17_007366 [Amanita inopinata Kibby_2008]|nr:hypothetical protein AX17_007366 [Amanita inopinata Kibby_2008]